MFGYSKKEWNENLTKYSATSNKLSTKIFQEISSSYPFLFSFSQNVNDPSRGQVE